MVKYCKIYNKELEKKILTKGFGSDHMNSDALRRFQEERSLKESLKDLFRNYVEFMEFSEDHDVNALVFNSEAGLLVYGDRDGGFIFNDRDMSIDAKNIKYKGIIEKIAKENNLDLSLVTKDVYYKMKEEAQKYIDKELEKAGDFADIVFVNNCY